MSKQLDWKSKLSAALESAHENAAPLTTKARLKSIWPQVLRLMEEGYPYAQIVGYLREGGIEITESYFRMLVVRFRAQPPPRPGSPKEEKQRTVDTPGSTLSEVNSQAKWEPQKKFVWNSESTDDVFRTGKSDEQGR